MRRRFLWAAVLLAGVPLLGFGALYVASELRLRSYQTPPRFTTPIPDDSASLAWGRHLTRTRGCFGCHGQSLEGQVFEEEWPWVRRAVAPNLAVYARRYEAQTLADAIRAGVGHDGRALWSMPSYNFKHLPDEELAALMAYLRSADVVERPLPRPSLGWSARWRIATGRDEHMAAWAEQVPDLILDPTDDPQLVRGERLAMTTVGGLRGADEDRRPDRRP